VIAGKDDERREHTAAVSIGQRKPAGRRFVLRRRPNGYVALTLRLPALGGTWLELSGIGPPGTMWAAARKSAKMWARLQWRRFSGPAPRSAPASRETGPDPRGSEDPRDR
jgi:hypothetical protein